MKRLLAAVAPLALVACGAPASPEPSPKEPPPIVAQPPAQKPQPQPELPPPPPPKEETAPAAPAPTIVVGEAPPPAVDRAKPAEPPPVSTYADPATVQESLRLERARRQQRVDDAKARITELEKRFLAISNPYLPRPQLPPEEEEAWKGLDGIQRRKRVEGQLADAREELKQAEAALAELPAD